MRHIFGARGSQPEILLPVRILLRVLYIERGYLSESWGCFEKEHPHVHFPKLYFLDNYTFPEVRSRLSSRLLGNLQFLPFRVGKQIGSRFFLAASAASSFRAENPMGTEGTFSNLKLFQF